MLHKKLFKKFRKGKLKNTKPVQLTEMNDAEVLAYSLKDPNAFAEIVNRYERLFVRKAREIIHNEDDAYDVVQDTFVRIYSAAKKFKAKDTASFRSWAYTILVRQCYTLYNKQKRRSMYSIPLSPEMIEIMPDEAERGQREEALTMENVLALISKLPAKLRRVVQLYFIDGSSQKEIAEIENLSPVAVRVRIHRAKKELQKLHLEDAI